MIDSYRLTKRELIESICIYVGVILMVSYLFYDSLYLMILFSPLLPIYIKYRKKELTIKKKNVIREQFCEMIYSVATSLSAGLSPENAFVESSNDMTKMFGKDSYMAFELEKIVREISLGRTIESSLIDLGINLNIDEISDFSVVFSEAKRSGGNLREIINRTASIVRQKMDCEKEIQVLLNGKILEQKIMSIIPFLIILYMRISSNEFMTTLYHNVNGIVVMTFCLALYGCSVYFANKLVCIYV